MTDNQNQYNQIDNNNEVHRRNRSDSMGAFHHGSNNDDQRHMNEDDEYNNNDDNEGYDHNNSYHIMPSPKTVFRQGSQQLWDAYQNREVILSLPDQASVEEWMDFRSGRFVRTTTQTQTASIKKSSSNKEKVRKGSKHPLSPRPVSSSLQRKHSAYHQIQHDSHSKSNSSSVYGTNESHDHNNIAPQEQVYDDLNYENSKILPTTIHEENLYDMNNQCYQRQEGEGEENGGDEEKEEQIENYIDRNVSDSSANSFISNGDENHVDKMKDDSFEETYESTSKVLFNSNPRSPKVNDKKRKRSDDEIHSVTSIANVQGESKKKKARHGSIPQIGFKDIVGHQSAKLRLDEILVPLELPVELSKSVLHGIRSLPASVLLHGPPGTGKTSLAKAAAGESNAAFLPVGPSDILSKFVGESETAVRNIFSKAVQMAQGIESKLAIIFFDEIDALGQSRGSSGNSSGGRSPALSPGSTQDTRGMDACSRRVLAELLIQLTRINSMYGHLSDDDGHGANADESCSHDDNQSIDGHSSIHDEETGQFDDEDSGEILYNAKKEHGHDEKPADERSISTNESAEEQGNTKPVRVLVMAATNRPEDCDPALIRRFAIQVKVGLPREKARTAMLKRHLTGVENTLTEVDFIRLANALDGFSGSDIESLSREAAMAPVRDCIQRAVRLKRRAERYRSEGSSTDKPYRSHQEYLVNEFTSLRPVGFQDFVNSLKFWASRSSCNAGMGSPKSPLQKLGIPDADIEEHYDSSSDEEDYDEDF
jgi:SpoVK/Ycf46/Vps4 family AAA+-type ATPase